MFELRCSESESFCSGSAGPTTEPGGTEVFAPPGRDVPGSMRPARRRCQDCIIVSPFVRLIKGRLAPLRENPSHGQRRQTFTCSVRPGNQMNAPDSRYVLMSSNTPPTMKYAYENLGDEQFETLVVFLCQKLLGVAVQGFSKGPDGGRDAKFVGTAELHPSKLATSQP